MAAHNFIDRVGEQESAIPGWNVDGTKREPASGKLDYEGRMEVNRLIEEAQDDLEGVLFRLVAAHNASLAAAVSDARMERESTIEELEKQLAAAVEARQALERLLEGVEIPFNIHSDICAALAKIGGKP